MTSHRRLSWVQKPVTVYNFGDSIMSINWPASRHFWALFPQQFELEITNTAELHGLCGHFALYVPALQSSGRLTGCGTGSELAWSSSVSQVPEHRGHGLGTTESTYHCFCAALPAHCLVLCFMDLPSSHGLSQDSGDPSLDQSPEVRKVHVSTYSQVSLYLRVEQIAACSTGF